MTRIIAAISLLVFVVGSVSASAREYADEGYYTGAAFLFASAQGDFDADGIGGSLRAGNHGLFVPWIATEIQFDYLDYDAIKFETWHARRPGKGPRVLSVEAQQWMVSVNLRAFPLQALDTDVLGGRLQPFALLGAGYGHAILNRSGSAWETADGERVEDYGFSGSDGAFLRVGGGTNAFFTETLSLYGTISYSIGTGGIKDIETVNIVAGLQYYLY